MSLQITTCMASTVHIISTKYKELLQLHQYKTTVGFKKKDCKQG
jgi:hypothetical protein